MTLSNALAKPVNRCILFILFWGLSAAVSAAQKLNIAVAANFKPVLEEISHRYQRDSDVEIDLIVGSTGALFAQITHGAPFDLFFAADLVRPLKLEQAGKTRKRMTYAYGQLALYGPGLTDVGPDSLRASHRIAIANPRHAPYGRAALQTLKSLDVTHPELVYGSNVAQAFAFVATGNTPLGLIALSQLKWSDQPAPATTHYWVVPFDYYQPIEQQLVIIKEAPVAAEVFVQYLTQPEIRALLLSAGYRLAEVQ